MQFRISYNLFQMSTLLLALGLFLIVLFLMLILKIAIE